MSRTGRGLLVTIFNNFVNSLKPRSFKGKLIGKDYLGNEYYEVTPPSHSTKQRVTRYFVPDKGDMTKFDEGLPPEWDSWLRLKRKQPPTEDEINKNLALAVQKKANALKIEHKFHPPELEPPKPETTGSYPKYKDFELHPGDKSSK